MVINNSADSQIEIFIVSLANPNSRMQRRRETKAYMFSFNDEKLRGGTTDSTQNGSNIDNLWLHLFDNLIDPR